MRLRRLLAAATWMGCAVFAGGAPCERADAGDAAPPSQQAASDDVGRRAASELWKAVEDAKKKELFGEARRQAARILELDPDHRGARTLLGFTRKGDAWVPDAALAAKTPTADLPSSPPKTDLRPALRDWRHGVLRAAEKRAAEVYAAYANKLGNAGDAEGARTVRLTAVSFDPDLPGVRAALNQVKWKDVWVAPDQVRQADAARGATEGKGAGELEPVAGTGLTRIETARCVFVSRMPAAQLVKWAQACEDVISLLLVDLGRNAGDAPVSTKLRFVVCTTDDQWNAWVDGTQEKSKRDFYRKLYGVWGPAWSYGVRPVKGAENVDEQIRDQVVHRAAHWALTQGFGVPWMSWIDEGLTHHYVLRSEGRAGTWCANPVRTDYAAKPQDGPDDAWVQPDEWRDLVWRMVSANDPVPLRALGLRKIHEQPTVAAIEAWSVMSWWRATDAPGLRSFLTKLRTAEGDVTKAVETARAARIEDVEHLWRAWVLID